MAGTEISVATNVEATAKTRANVVSTINVIATAKPLDESVAIAMATKDVVGGRKRVYY